MVSTHQPGISPRVQNKWGANYRQLLTSRDSLRDSFARAYFFIFLINFLSAVPVAVCLQPVGPVNPAATNLGPTQAECDRPIPAAL
ncbi:hypothetical protein QUB70_22840 [Microcoleus sp. A003_D6]|uniref:hypothetical protein n=1 Tax=Microcoleus sp. A003_D6 TaxID=3055266 RepID=UPI002FCEAA63